nr:uncharacterized protein LOC107453583 [Parasteatoda tepidariorum]
MYNIFIVILAIFQVSYAVVCPTRDCGITNCNIKCNEGFREVFALCDCCLTCEQVLGFGDRCEVIYEPAVVSARSAPRCSRRFTTVNTSYPRCGPGLVCNEYLGTCVYDNLEDEE